MAVRPGQGYRPTMSVEHDRFSRRFTVAATGGTAVLAYAHAGSGLVELYSTYVPPADRGRGIAARLVQAAVEYARAEGLQIIPSCWYVAQWMRDHPEHADLVAH